MRLIRQLIYRLGCRPKPRSIFYSPSKDAVLAGRDALTAFEKGYDAAIGLSTFKPTGIRNFEGYDGYRDPPANGSYYSRADDIREGFGGAGE